MNIEDAAQQHEAAEWERRQSARPVVNTYASDHPKYGPEFCVECDEPMPALRRSHGWCLCTSCKTVQERRVK